MDRKGIQPVVVFAVLIALLGAIAAGYYFWRRPAPATPEPAAVERPPEPEPPPPAPPRELLPPLAESDSLVRTVVAELSSHPRLLAWIGADADLVRTLVAAVDRVAAGESPREQLAAWAPAAPFEARATADGGLVAAPGTTARYDLLVDIATAVDTESAALAYRRLRPLLTEAYREIGAPDASFDSALAAAVAELLAVPVVRAPALDATVDGYRYRDPALEDLSPAQKHLLRMGATNVERVQAALRAFARAVELPTG